MIEAILKKYKATLVQLPKTLPTIFRAPHLLMQLSEPYEYLLLVDLWFYAQLNQLNLNELLLAPMLPTQINQYFSKVDRAQQEQEIQALLQKKIDTETQLERKQIQPINRLINQKTNSLNQAHEVEKIKIESEINRLKITLSPFMAQRARLIAQIAQLATLADHLENQPVVLNRFLLKTFLNVIEPELLLIEIPEDADTSQPFIRLLVPSAERIKQYVSESIKAIANTKENICLFGIVVLNTDPSETKSKSLGIDFKNRQILDPTHGIISLNSTETLANCLIDLLKLEAMQANSNLWGAQLNLFYQYEMNGISKQKSSVPFIDSIKIKQILSS